MKRNVKAVLSTLAFLLGSTAVHAGPVILGGDDLTAHGSFNGTNNVAGWLYIEKAVSNLLTNQTRAGPIFTSDIAALGSAASAATSGNAGAAIGSAASALSKTVSYFNGAVAINQFFADLGTGVVNPRVIWLAGNDAANDLDASEGLALTANAIAINNFVLSGGGLMSHGAEGAANITIAYGWLTALLPGLNAVPGCSATGATLTPAGNAAFPGLSNSNVSSGPCHNSFSGNFGGLVTLAFDGNTPARSFIIGGGTGAVLQCGLPGQAPCPTQVPEPGILSLLGVALLGMLGVTRRKVNYLRG